MTKSTFKGILFLSFLFSFSLLTQKRSLAQTPVYPANPETILVSGVDAENINCDMVFCGVGAGGKIRAYVYDDVTSGDSYLQVEDYAGGSTTITIPNASFPDVVIGDDFTFLGKDFIIGVVYEDNGAVKLSTYALTGVNTGILSCSLNTTVLLSKATSISAKYPHIDMIGDNKNLVTKTLPSLHEFAITWSEQIFGSSGYDIFAATGDISSPTSLTNYTITSGARGIMSDVAGTTYLHVNTPHAHIVYRNTASGDLDVADIDLSSSTISVNSSIASNITTLARIESMNLDDPFHVSWTLYQVAYTKYNGTYNEVWSYSDVHGSISLSGSNFHTDDNLYPAIAAGVGAKFLLSNYGNDNYTEAWWNSSNKVWSQAIDLFTGAISTTYPNYYCANNTNTTYTLPQHCSPVAVSNSSNDGTDLLTVWKNGTDIYYKITPDCSAYKPTNVNDLTERVYNIYPNPATDKIAVTGLTKASYKISDITGRYAGAGNITAIDNTIKINHLQPAVYFLTIQEDGSSYQAKFLKQ